jgi:hypothetical protein
MECEGCGSATFINVEDSHVVCTQCARQTAIKRVIYQPFSSTPSFGKTVRRVTQKEKKTVQREILSTNDYLKHYQKVLELCVLDLVDNCGMPSTVSTAAIRLWSLELAKASYEGVIAPKNSDD